MLQKLFKLSKQRVFLLFYYLWIWIFFEKVYEIVKQIPYGKVTTYGLIANALGTKKSARMVGWAMNASHNREDIPAHRVVNRKGILTGKFHFEGTKLMQQLLENEGIKVENDQIVDFEKHLWIPEKAVIDEQ